MVQSDPPPVDGLPAEAGEVLLPQIAPVPPVAREAEDLVEEIL